MIFVVFKVETGVKHGGTRLCNQQSRDRPMKIKSSRLLSRFKANLSYMSQKKKEVDSENVISSSSQLIMC